MVEAAGIEAPSPVMGESDNTGQPRTDTGQDHTQPGPNQQLVYFEDVEDRTGSGQGQVEHENAPVHSMCIAASIALPEAVRDGDGTLAGLQGRLGRFCSRNSTTDLAIRPFS